MLILCVRNDGFPFCIAESDNRSYNRQLFQQRAPLFVQIIPSRRSKLFLSPTLLGYASASFAQWETGRTSGVHSELLTAVIIHEVLNTIVIHPNSWRVCTIKLVHVGL